MRPPFDALDKGAQRIAKGPDGSELVPADMTYYEWLKTQPASFQNDAIGPRRAELLRNGGLSAKRFSELNLGRNFQPLTLEEMKRVEPGAFERAAEMAAKEGIMPQSVGSAENPLNVGEKYGLTLDETGSILKYISSESYAVNEKLRDNIPLDDSEKRMIKNLDSALEKMPNYPGKIYRSLYIENADDFVKEYEVGKHRLFREYLSSGVEVYDERFQVQYVIKSKEGKDIRAFNKDETEILFRRNTTFLVNRVDGHTIYMTEI